MWVPVAVWQPCELLYTCYLLTKLKSCDACGLAVYVRTFLRKWLIKVLYRYCCFVASVRQCWCVTQTLTTFHASSRGQYAIDGAVVFSIAWSGRIEGLWVRRLAQRSTVMKISACLCLSALKHICAITSRFFTRFLCLLPTAASPTPEIFPNAATGKPSHGRNRTYAADKQTLFCIWSETSAGFSLEGQCPLAAWSEENFENLTMKWCILKYIWINMWSAFVVLYICLPWLLSKYNINTENYSFCMFSLFNFSSILGGQLTPFAPMCGRPCI